MRVICVDDEAGIVLREVGQIDAGDLGSDTRRQWPKSARFVCLCQCAALSGFSAPGCGRRRLLAANVGQLTSEFNVLAKT